MYTYPLFTGTRKDWHLISDVLYDKLFNDLPCLLSRNGFLLNGLSASQNSDGDNMCRRREVHFIRLVNATVALAESSRNPFDGSSVYRLRNSWLFMESAGQTWLPNDLRDYHGRGTQYVCRNDGCTVLLCRQNLNDFAYHLDWTQQILLIPSCAWIL